MLSNQLVFMEFIDRMSQDDALRFCGRLDSESSLNITFRENKIFAYVKLLSCTVNFTITFFFDYKNETKQKIRNSSKFQSKKRNLSLPFTVVSIVTSFHLN